MAKKTEAEGAASEEVTELYKRYRPRTLDQVIGQDGAVRQLRKMLDTKSVDRLLLFHGPSGSGKTTLGRIVARELGCKRLDFQELNAAGEFRGIDTVRALDREAGMAPGESKARVWLIDECHQLTGPAQQAMLKMLEDTPKHVWFMLATTEPTKVIKTIRNRAVEIALRPFDLKTMRELLVSVLEQEGVPTEEFGPDLIDKIYEASESSPRKALVLAGQALRFRGDEAAMLAAIGSTGDPPAAYELVKLLLPWGPRRAGWGEVAAQLEALKEAGEDAEKLRHMLLANGRALLVKGKNAGHHRLGATAIDCLRNPYFDKNSGHALLAVAAYEILNAK